MKTHKPIRIGVLTSGGDAPGMNPAVRAVVRAALKRGADVYAIHEGYYGMVFGGELIQKMKWDDVSGVIHKGGTCIGTGRCKEFMTSEGRQAAVWNLLQHEIDCLICIGGDGSLTGADLLKREWKEHIENLVKEGKVTKEVAERRSKLSIVGIVGSIDNDMCGTDNTIGADSALNRISETVDYISTTASSHKRAFVIEVMGRNCGYLALASSVICGADYCIIPEDPHDDWAKDMVDSLKKKHHRRCTIVIVAEGAKDTKGNPIKGDMIVDVLQKELNLETRVTIPGHVQRGGPPTAFDRYMGTMTGVAAVDTLLNEHGKEPQLIGMSGYTVTKAPLMESVRRTRELKELVNKQQYDKVIECRGAVFNELLKAEKILRRKGPGSLRHYIKKKLRIGIVNVGASSPGMNAALRVIVRAGINYGHSMFEISQGFEGFERGDIKPTDWEHVSGWAPHGGCFMGCSRALPNLEKVAKQIKEFNIQALILVGGFESFVGMKMLKENMDKYPEFKIPMLVIPATISNNLPSTHVSIGMDRGTTNIMDGADKLIQSAMSYRRRAFIMECFGGQCGYLTLMSGLVSGAREVYLSEEGITLKLLTQHIEELNRIDKLQNCQYKMSDIFMRNEAASALYTTPFITKLFEKETSKHLSVRMSIQGHVQQGGNPTPLDRINATRLALASILYLNDNPTSTSGHIVGIVKGKIKLTELKDVEPVDFSARRPKQQWWYKPMRSVFNEISKELDPSCN